MNNALKILICGEGGVGKTSFLKRYIYEEFDEKSEITKGIEFFDEKIDINDEDMHLSLNLSLWDFSGQERFRFIFPSLMKGVKGVFFVFDLTRMSSLDRIEEWFEMLESYGNIPILLLGSKADLIGNGESSLIDDLASEIIKTYENCFDYVKFSSKTGENVKESFHILVNKLAREIVPLC